MSARVVLAIGLLLLATLYGVWFGRGGSLVPALVFAAPPLLLALASRWKPRGVAFWSGVLALAWFSHAVMVAWSRPGERGLALCALVLSLLIVFSANWRGLHARFARRRSSP